MTVAKIVVLALIGILPALLFTGRAADAADCASYDTALADAAAKGIAPYSIPADKLQTTVQDVEHETGDDYGAVTRGFMYETDTELIIGFEASGCLLDPIHLGKPQGGGT